MIPRLLAAAPWLLVPALAFADVPAGLHAALAKNIPTLVPDRIEETPVAGIYEVWYGTSVYYASADGRYVMRGDLIDLENRRNLTEAKRGDARRAIIGKVADESTIVFSPAQPKHTVTVFTDVDCGYCRRLHGQMAEYNDLGIRVRYLAFPRAGVPSASYDTMVSVWCADDPKQAMTEAKSGRTVAKKTCGNPVAEQYHLGQAFGINGTPTIVLENGDVVPGYVPPARLLEMIEQKRG